MTIPTFKNKVAGICAVVLAGLLLQADSLYAQQFSTVMNLRYNNQPVEAADIDVLPPKGKGANSKKLSKGAQLASGTTLIIPPNTLVQLQSYGGTQNLRPGNGPMEYTVDFTAKSENHTVNGAGASISNKVNPGKYMGYDYRNTNGRGTTAASKATEFTFTDWSSGDAEKARVITTEGAVHITDQRPITINGEPVENGRKGDKTGESVAVSQSAGSGEFVSSHAPVNYNSYEEAVKVIGGQLANATGVDRADNLMCLGDLCIDLNKPEQAIRYFNEAYKYYGTAYGNDAAETLEAQLSLAEAYKLAGQAQKGTQIATQAVDILMVVLDDIDEDLKFVGDDLNAVELLCDDVIVVALMCGWAYEIIGNDQASAELYKIADEGCK